MRYDRGRLARSVTVLGDLWDASFLPEQNPGGSVDALRLDT